MGQLHFIELLVQIVMKVQNQWDNKLAHRHIKLSFAMFIYTQIWDLPKWEYSIIFGLVYLYIESLYQGMEKLLEQ